MEGERPLTQISKAKLIKPSNQLNQTFFIRVRGLPLPKGEINTGCEEDKVFIAQEQGISRWGEMAGITATEHVNPTLASETRTGWKVGITRSP